MKKSDSAHKQMTANEWTANMPEHHLEGYSSSKKSVAQVKSLSKAEIKAQQEEAEESASESESESEEESESESEASDSEEEQ